MTIQINAKDGQTITLPLAVNIATSGMIHLAESILNKTIVSMVTVFDESGHIIYRKLS